MPLSISLSLSLSLSSRDEEVLVSFWFLSRISFQRLNMIRLSDQLLFFLYSSPLLDFLLLLLHRLSLVSSFYYYYMKLLKIDINLGNDEELSIPRRERLRREKNLPWLVGYSLDGYREWLLELQTHLMMERCNLKSMISSFFCPGGRRQ